MCATAFVNVGLSAAPAPRIGAAAVAVPTSSMEQNLMALIAASTRDLELLGIRDFRLGPSIDRRDSDDVRLKSDVVALSHHRSKEGSTIIG